MKATRLLGSALVLMLAGCSSATQAARPTSTPTLTSQVSTPSPTPLPAAVWVNAGLGVSLRVAPDVAKQRMEVLAQASKLAVLGQSPDGQWFWVQAPDGQRGWVNGAFVVTGAIFPFSDAAAGWSLMLPQGYTTQVSQAAGRPVTQVLAPGGDATPFLQVEAGAALSDLSNPVPAGSHLDHSRSIVVWSYTVPERVYQLSDGRYLTLVRVILTGHAYQFTFWSQSSDSPTVAQVLDSAILP